jgi:hypothetical protein
MRRIAVYIALSFSVMLGVAAIANGALAQESTPQAGIIPEPVHPIVGTWIVVDPDGIPGLTSFTSDGVVTDLEADGGVGLGTWQPTGERTAAFTMVLLVSEEDFAASIQINVVVTIDASGNSGTAEFTYTAVLADGTVADSGSGNVTISRLMVQPLDAMGTPMAGIPTWNPSADEGEGTPEATPAS